MIINGRTIDRKKIFVSIRDMQDIAKFQICRGSRKNCMTTMSYVQT